MPPAPAAKTTVTLVSWNVNGLRAAMKKDFPGALQRLDADVVAIQETKLQSAQLDESMAQVPGYSSFWSHCEAKKGYSGVGVYSRLAPLRSGTGIGQPRFDREGRIIELDFGRFVFFNVYFPNGQMSAERLQYKLDFYDAFFDYADALRRQGRSLVIGGDYNTAHNEIDLANPKANEKTSGFLRIERDWLDRIIARGYVDTFRRLHRERGADQKRPGAGGVHRRRDPGLGSLPDRGGAGAMSPRRPSSVTRPPWRPRG